MSLLHHLFVIAVALAVTVAVTPFVRHFSARAGLMDRGGARKVHTSEMSRLGGVAIFAGFAAAVAAQLFGELVLHFSPVLLEADGPLIGTMVGLATIFAVGLVDDIRGLSPGWKFIGQLVAAAMPIAAGLRVEFVGNPIDGGLFQLGYLSYPVTALWIVGFANVINLIDGLDGLAAGISAIAAGSFLLLAIQMNQLVAAVLAAAIIGACGGFLYFNFHPASIIMGDSGALTLGFALACMSLTGVMKSAAAITLVVTLLVIGVPIFDTASAIIRRWRHGRPIQEADNGHIHHRLLHRGFNQRQTVLIIYAWSIALAIGGYAMSNRPARFVPIYLRIAVFVVLAVLSGLMANWLGLFERARVHGDEDG
jgi:UDP-GlcNAc:undecaprenyl-phosphate/decaprenyl-phosphate GlcNAc-1-phosphate transferase